MNGDLVALADKLLAGTGLSVDAAVAVASGAGAGSGDEATSPPVAVASALRDGWRAAEWGQR